MDLAKKRKVDSVTVKLNSSNTFLGLYAKFKSFLRLNTFKFKVEITSLKFTTLH